MDPLEAAREILPAWVIWGPLYSYLPLIFVWALVFTAAGAALGGLPPARTQEEAPNSWVERARRAYPARLGTALLATFLPLFAAMIAWLFAGYLLPIGSAGLATLAFVSAWLGCAVVRYRVERRILGALTARLFVSGTLVRWLFFLWPLLLILFANLAADDRFGARSALVLGVTGVCFAALSFGANISIGRWVGLVEHADARVVAIVDRVAASVGRAPSGVWVAKTGLANAWILIIGRELLWTSRALEVLDDDELAAITAHELGHLSESRRVRSLRILRLMLFLPLCAARPIAGEFGIGTVALLIAGFLFSMVALGRTTRRMESRADHVAHAHQGDAGTYARALERLYRANQSPAVTRGRGGVHGHLYDRLTAAGTTPGYPRPAPPPRWRSSAASVLPLGVGVFALLIARILIVVWVSLASSQGATLVGAAFGGLDHQMLETLAEQADSRGELHDADVFFAAADFVLPTQPEPTPPDPFDRSE
ncbi:MAG: M48 family metalloprotease [Deltaproteobacteria bacterium]|nr:M48 family metalloprotease [Deltaproteobacteria bacterium]